MTRHPSQATIAQALIAITCVDVALFAAYVVLAFYPAPLMDALYFLDDALSGTPSLWGQFGEQRPVLVRLATSADLALFDGRGIFQAILGLAALTGLACLSVRLATIGKAGLHLAGATLAIVLLTRNYGLESYVWPHGLHFILVAATAGGSLAAVILPVRLRPGWIAVSAILALAASLSLSSGLLVWPLLVAAALMRRAHPAATILLALAGIAIFALFLADYTLPREQTDPAGALGRPLEVAWYVLHLFGTPWARSASLGWTGLVFGAIVPVAWAWSMACVVAQWRRGHYARFETLCAFLLTFAGGAALMTALARLDFGPLQAVQPRYAPNAMLGHVAASLFLLSRLPAGFHRPAQAAIAGFMLLIAVEQVVVGELFRMQARTLDDVRSALIAGSREDFRVRQIYPHLDAARKALSKAQEAGASIFAAPGARLVGAILPHAQITCDIHLDAVWHQQGAEWGASGATPDRAGGRRVEAVLIVDSERRAIGYGRIVRLRRELPAKFGWQGIAVPRGKTDGFIVVGVLSDGQLCGPP